MRRPAGSVLEVLGSAPFWPHVHGDACAGKALGGVRLT